jgi:hypothetical protein
MKRVLVACAAASLAVVYFPAAAAADPAALNTSYAAAAKVTPGGGVTPQLTTSGALGSLLDFLTPVLNQVVTPLTTQLTGLPSTLVADLVTGLTASGYSAASPTSAQSPPASGFPNCSSNGWSADDCFGPLVPTVSAAPLLTVGSGTLQGYAAADSTGAFGQAQTAGVLLSVLGISVGNLGAATSASQCLSSRVCTSSATLTSLSLLGGTVAAKTASDGSLLVSLSGGSYAALSTLSSPVTLTPAGILSASAQAVGGALQLKIGLSLTDLLSAFGIPNVLASLNATDTGSTVSLTLTIGPGTKSATDSATAWGLEVGIGLSANIQLSILGLVTVGVVVPADSTTGNLVDLQLAYTSAANADVVNPSGAPPALT